jgi:hypothetical protein
MPPCFDGSSPCSKSMRVDLLGRWPTNCACLRAASTVGSNVTTPTPAWKGSAANPAKAVHGVGMNGWRRSSRRCWPGPRRTFGHLATGWTVPLLQQVLAQGRPEPALSEDTIRRRLHERGYVWKRFRYVLSPDPQREKKTPASPPNPGLARAHRALGPGRNRVIALAAPAGGLGPPGRTRAGTHQRPKRAADRLRQPAPADWPRAVFGPEA